MCREIKFRAWDKDVNQMVQNIEFHANYICNDKEQIFVVMQFTGLKDKNGKEIYEGDIVTLDWDKKAIGEIQWGAGFWKLKWNKDGKHMNERVFVLTGQGTGSVAPFEYSNGSLEVIGNVHENPELLEKKDG